MLRLVSVVALTCSLLLGAPAVSARAPQSQVADARVSALLEEANKLSSALKLDEALAKADEAQALAERIGDRVGIAMSYNAKGLAMSRVNANERGREWYERGLAAFEVLQNKAGMATSLSGLVAQVLGLGDSVRALEYGKRAMQLFAEIGDDRGRAYVLQMLAYGQFPNETKDAWFGEFQGIATRLNDDVLLGHAFRTKGARQFQSGDLAGARDSYQTAIARFEKTGDLATLAAVYVSLGRVFRAHGDYEGAIERYQKAIDLLLPTRERYSIVEATNAKAIALGNLNRQQEALATYERGLALAREGGNPLMIDFMEGNLAGGLISAREFARAIPALEAVIAKKPGRSILGYRLAQLATALLEVGRAADAITPSIEGVRIARESKDVDILAGRLGVQAGILRRLGRFDEALDDAREANGITEETRTKLIPSDFLRRGYGERTRQAYSLIVDLLSELGRVSDAVESSEQGRTRAFLDLLATRESQSPSLDTRGPTTNPPSSSRTLSSEAIGKPANAADIGRIAERLGSTIVSFWVTDESTLAFVVRPGAAATQIRIPIKSTRLGELVARTTALLREPAKDATTRGAADSTPLTMRGLGVLALGRDDKSAWRELHNLLIEPLRAQLPARGGRVTIVPHGPLFQLAFSALQSASGRYLVEDYEIDYAPSISVLDFTGRRQQAVKANSSGAWAIVGNPALLPTVGSRALAPLPGAAREIASVAALAPHQVAVVRLDGIRADEAAVTAMLEKTRPAVLHFATHGFVFEDPKQPPFLALNRRGAGEADDGRLTLDEVYGLGLSTDLVVLSACRTGVGQVSTDGVMGLTRGFFYAGSPSVLATFWDVTDEATVNLMSGFYRRYVKTHAKGASLRQAQLALLADLRAGKVIITAGGRRITLPEHPLLWAAFFLSGEP